MSEMALDQPRLSLRTSGKARELDSGVLTSSEENFPAGVALAPFKYSSRCHEYQCTHCNYNTPIIEVLTKHMRFHDPARKYQCRKCLKRYTSRRNLEVHQETHDPPSFKCSFCDKTFRCLKFLKTHQGVHTGYRPYICSVVECGQSFLTSSQLAHHVARVHRDERLFKCAMCGQTFTHSNGLKIHMRHTFHPQSVDKIN